MLDLSGSCVAIEFKKKKQARKLQATLVRNYDPPTHRLAHRGEV